MGLTRSLLALGCVEYIGESSVLVKYTVISLSSLVTGSPFGNGG